MLDWLFRFIKGALIGIGFILPGVSGGALAAIFGLYERIISFIAHLHKEFIKNALFFLPVALGGLFGIIILARPLSYLLEHYEAYVLWGFIGCIVGMLPPLWQRAGLKGRKRNDYWVLLIATVISFTILFYVKRYLRTDLQLNIFSWLFGGVLIALGTLLPGVSSSVLLICFGLYNPLLVGFKKLDMLVLLPLFTGLGVCMIAFSKLVHIFIERRYSTVYHIIVGIVIASTAMIVPLEYNYLHLRSLFCLLTLGLGIGLGYWMCRLEAKYKS